MTPSSVKRATLDDLATLQSIEDACFAAAAWSGRTLQQSVEDPGQDVVLTTTGDAYGVVRVAGDTADLDRIAALPSVRRRGVGREVLSVLTDRAVRRGAVRMLLEVAEDNVAARALYDSTGFSEIHRRRRYYPGGVDAVVMERPLAD